MNSKFKLTKKNNMLLCILDSRVISYSTTFSFYQNNCQNSKTLEFQKKNISEHGIRVGWENPQKLTHLSPRFHQRHLVGKRRTAQKDAIKDIACDSQVYSYFPYRWSPASLTFNIYCYLSLYLYITRITINNGKPHLKSAKNQTRRAALERTAIKF